MSGLTDAQLATLAAIADVIIPPSAKYGVPGAGDPAIVAEMAGDARRRLEKLKRALALLDEAAGGDGFAALEPDARTAVGEGFRTAHPAAATMLQNLAAQCYYRDDRVVASLGMELRPPHPVGFEVPDGDWSLLDPVRRRDRLYRPTGEEDAR